MIKVLVSDNIHGSGIRMLQNAGYQVTQHHYEAEELREQLPEYDVIIVRSATKVRQDLISLCPRLKVIARAGVGLDNIDVDFAKAQHIEVLNTPAASSRAVAELVFAHMLALSRKVYLANQEMPKTGHTDFKKLKKSYSKTSIELSGKTLGIIGLGRIGQEVARIGLAMGMHILPVDPFVDEASIEMDFPGYPEASFKATIKSTTKEDMLRQADFVTLHIPFTGSAVMGKSEFEQMKNTAYLINCARGGTVDDQALLHALENELIAGAGLDVYEDEPTPAPELLQHERISVSPHIGGSTQEAQEKISIELAEQIIAFLGDDAA